MENIKAMPPEMAGLRMASSACMLGILSLFSTFIVPVYMPLVLGSVAIVTGHLSRGSGRISGRALAGMWLGILAIVGNLVMLALGAWLIINVPQYRDQFMQLLEMTGISLPGFLQ